jgi:hypothetical protein
LITLYLFMFNNQSSWSCYRYLFQNSIIVIEHTICPWYRSLQAHAIDHYRTMLWVTTESCYESLQYLATDHYMLIDIDQIALWCHRSCSTDLCVGWCYNWVLKGILLNSQIVISTMWKICCSWRWTMQLEKCYRVYTYTFNNQQLNWFLPSHILQDS